MVTSKRECWQQPECSSVRRAILNDIRPNCRYNTAQFKFREYRLWPKRTPVVRPVVYDSTLQGTYRDPTQQKPHHAPSAAPAPPDPSGAGGDPPAPGNSAEKVALQDHQAEDAESESPLSEGNDGRVEGSEHGEDLDDDEDSRSPSPATAAGITSEVPKDESSRLDEVFAVPKSKPSAITGMEATEPTLPSPASSQASETVSVAEGATAAPPASSAGETEASATAPQETAVSTPPPPPPPPTEPLQPPPPFDEAATDDDTPVAGSNEGEEKIDETPLYIPPPPAPESKDCFFADHPYAKETDLIKRPIPSSVAASMYWFRIVNYFINMNGFDSLVNYITAESREGEAQGPATTASIELLELVYEVSLLRCPLNLMCTQPLYCLVDQLLSFLRRQLPAESLRRWLEQLWPTFLSRMCYLEEDEVRRLKWEDVLRITGFVETLMREVPITLSDGTETTSHTGRLLVDECRLNTALRYLQSSQLSKRLIGLSRIKHGLSIAETEMMARRVRRLEL